ncbi:MYND-type domain-containing protein [Mycena kentingensis (nom. inval.)]|nr:MYND-type domain-containing protein [Mycena kentingensis (nom. inval.)]
MATASDAFIARFTSEPEKTLSKPEALSASEISHIAQIWQSRRPVVSVVAVLRVFLRHLDAKLVPKQAKAPTDNDPAARAYAALHGLDYRWTSDFAEYPGLRTQLLAAWPGLFKWCTFLYQQRVTQEKSLVAAQKPILVISQAVRALLTDGELHPKIRKTDGIIGLCGRLCLHAASPLEAFIPLSLMGPLSWNEIDQIVAGVGSNNDTVGKIFVERLRRVVNAPSLQPEVMSVLLLILVAFIRHPEHSLTFFILLDHNVVWVVGRALTLCAQALDGSLEEGTVLEERQRSGLLSCIGCALMFLRAGVVEFEPPRLVAQAVDAGLLQAILLLSSKLDGATSSVETSARQHLRHILRVILPQSMMFLSVLRIMKREHRQIEGEMVDRTIALTGLHEDWISWMLLLTWRCHVAKIPRELKGTSSKLVSCDNFVQCGKAARKKELQRCSGCLYVYYCSKECQRAAWKQHKPMCRLKRDATTPDNTEGVRAMFTDSDARFIRELFSTDAHVHFPHLQKLAKRTTPLGTCSLKNIRTYRFPDIDKDAADPVNAAAQNEEMIKMVRRNPREFTFVEATFAHGKMKLTRNIMARTNLFTAGTQVRPMSAALDWQNARCENNDAGMPGASMQLLEMMIKSGHLDLDDMGGAAGGGGREE